MLDFKMPSYERHSIVTDLETVLCLIRENLNKPGSTTVVSERDKKSRKVRNRVPVNGVPVGVFSLRLRTFEKWGTVCNCCGLKATHFAIERDHNTTPSFPYHLNLWGYNEEGREILFTHDHTLARALGGFDSIDNTRTMCSICNWNKGIGEGVLAQAMNNK